MSWSNYLDNSKEKEFEVKLRKQIGKNLRAKRKYNKLNQDEIAEYLGLSPCYVGLVERGQRGINIPNILKLSYLYGCTIDELIEGLDDESNQESNNQLNLTLEMLKFNGKEEIKLISNIVKQFNIYLKKDLN